MSSMWRALRRFRQLSPRERRVLSMAAALLPTVDALQRNLPFRLWRRLLEREPPTRSSHPSRPSVREIAWSVDAARNWLPGGFRCLPSAYTAHVLLHHFGYASVVHVGVSRDPSGKLEAHAWVECEGNTVVGEVENLSRFLPLPPLHMVPR